MAIEELDRHRENVIRKAKELGLSSESKVLQISVDLEASQRSREPDYQFPRAVETDLQSSEQSQNVPQATDTGLEFDWGDDDIETEDLVRMSMAGDLVFAHDKADKDAKESGEALLKVHTCMYIYV